MTALGGVLSFKKENHNGVIPTPRGSFYHNSPIALLGVNPKELRCDGPSYDRILRYAPILVDFLRFNPQSKIQTDNPYT